MPINGKWLSLIFDSTTHICEVLVFLFLFVDENWILQQCTKTNAIGEEFNMQRNC